MKTKRTKKRSSNSKTNDLEVATIGWFAMIATAPRSERVRIADGLRMLSSVLENMGETKKAMKARLLERSRVR